MQAAPGNEKERLEALSEYAVLDTPPEEEFDRLVLLAARIFGAPMAAVSLVDADRLFLKASIGLPLGSIGRDGALCAHAIASDDIFCVKDASKDNRFAKLPLVTDGGIRFYAAAPLLTPTGQKLGTLCVIDDKPRRRFTEKDRRTLQDLSALVMDRMEIRRLNHAKQVSQSRFENIASASPDAIACADARGRITFWNAAAERLFGFPVEDAIGKSLEFMVPEIMSGAHMEGIRRIAQSGGPRLVGKPLELTGKRRDGSRFPAELSLSVWREGREVSFGAIIRNITDQRRSEEWLLHLAHIDSLTGLANRTALCTELDKTIAEGKRATVLLVDLDNFKDVNDTLGHTAGDAVLQAAAGRILSFVGATGMVGRPCGDEFAVIVADVDDPVQAATMSKGLCEALSGPLEIEGQTIHLGTSIGIAMCPAHGTDAEEVLANADLAAHRVKAEGGNGYQVFAPALRQAVIARRACEDELRRAFAEGEFELFYQPQVRLSDRRIVGAEALLRWRHPQRGLLSPAAFLSVLETGPLAAAVGSWTVRTACAQAAHWQRSGSPGFRIGVNLFGAQFRDGDLIATVKAALANNDLPPETLELEITENIILQHDAVIVAPLRELRASGVEIAFDDYGTGYASLSLLKRFPVTRLKIDQSFVRDLCADQEDAAIVQAILYLGKSFGLKVIAEGIETEAQEALLKEYGCVEGQGYLYARPMAAHQLTGLMTAGRLVA